MLADSEDLSASLVLVDEHTLETRWDESLNIGGQNITYDFLLESGRFIDIAVNGTRAVIAVLPLIQCLNIPGIQNGSLFRKNVRQALSKTTKVNKEITQSLRKSQGEFFFLHNGITAICSSLAVNEGVLHVEGLSVVNGCQSEWRKSQRLVQQ